MIDFNKRIKNSNKFRTSCLHYKKHGVYTFAPTGTTEYLNFWDEESIRCINGYTAPDGDWVSGYNYFYLNYCPIQRIVEEEYTDRHGVKKIRRIKSREFPDFYDYDYYFFLAVQEAEEQGKHLVVLKSRRKGYSFKCGSMMDRNYYLIPESKSYAYAAENEFLIKDGIITKSWEFMDFIDEHTAWAKKRQAVNTKMHRRASILTTDEMGNKIEVGYKSEVIGVTIKNDANKIRGKCFGKDTEILMHDGSIKNVQDIVIGDLVMGPDSTLRRVLETHSGTDMLYKITPINGDIQIVNSEHDIYYDLYQNANFRGETKRLLIKPREFMKCGSGLHARSGLIKTGVNFDKQEVPIDPYFIGIWIGDGSVGKTEITTIDPEIKKYVFDLSVELGCKFNSYSKIDNPLVENVYIHGGATGIRKNKVTNILRELGIYREKFIPDIYLKNDRDSRLRLLAGLIDTDGYYDHKYQRYEILQKRKVLSEQIVYLCRSLGFKTSINVKNIEGYGDYYRIGILSGLEEIPVKIHRKKHINRTKVTVNPNKTTFKVKEHLYGDYYGFTVDKDHLFLLSDFTIVHNSGKLILFEEAGKSPNLAEAWQVARPSVEQDGMAYGLMIAFGTGGTEGADFSGLRDMFYHPLGYNCLGFVNIWDDNATSTECGFFIPQYTNIDMDGKFMDKDGNTKTEFARDYILNLRNDVINNATASSTVDRYIAEQCITPAEACLELTGNIFPKKDLLAQLALIRVNKKLQSHKQCGDLVWINGELSWQITKNKDIIKYPLSKEDRTEGSIVIWEHPNKDTSGQLYIAGNDPYDQDKAGTNSLGSTFIYKRFQNFEEYYDIIVAEYTGRPETAEDYYENVRKLLVYYNARMLYENERKGLFVYFTQKHCEYLLADQPDIINDIIGKSTVQRRKGIHMNTQIKDYGEGLIKEWLNEEYSPGKKNLTRILSEPLLEELIQYNDKGNFDRVIAFMMIMIYRQQLHNLHVKEKNKDSRKMNLFDSPLFSRDWNNKEQDPLDMIGDNSINFTWN
jgi:hypothetical protein